jgi:hypothetical protein
MPDILSPVSAECYQKFFVFTKICGGGRSLELVVVGKKKAEDLSEVGGEIL